ncbi:MAG: sugar transferase [Candidatus Gastranaerophilales bacterium]|nr:sugar transferase [Candidatus Gastranaerophilales bacterium]
MSVTLEKMESPIKLLEKENKKQPLKFNPFWIARNFNLYLRHPFQWVAKRFIDYAGSIIGTILISPFLLLIAILVKLDSKGPVFFKQRRIGIYGKPFYMYKFRSMKPDAEKMLHLIKDKNETNDVMFKLEDDPRITTIGKILRKYSIDELPQLFNVIKGEMSLVGPRPPIPEELYKYENWHFLKFATLPGLTGVWQTSGRAKVKNFNKVIKMDYEYIEKWNLLWDIKLLFKTIPAVLFAKGAG